MLAERTIEESDIRTYSTWSEKVSKNIEILHGQIVRDDARVLADAFIFVD